MEISNVLKGHEKITSCSSYIPMTSSSTNQHISQRVPWGSNRRAWAASAGCGSAGSVCAPTNNSKLLSQLNS